MRIGYGLTDHVSGFENMTPEEVATQLVDLRCDGVFLKQLEPQWVEALQWSGLKVFASQTIFMDTDGLWQQFPDSRPLRADGTPAPIQEWYRPLLPVHPTVRAHRLGQIEALVKELPLDGLWLDFIRWPARWEQPRPQLYDSSFDALTLAQFVRDTGIALPAAAQGNPADAAHWLFANAEQAWLHWRCQQVASFVADAKAIVHKQRPDALLGCFTIPWVGEETERTGLTAPQIRIVGQDPRLLAEHADVLSPMVYHRLCGQPPAWTATVTERLRTACDETSSDVQVWPVVEAIDGPDAYPVAEFARVCQLALAAADAGLIAFKLDGLLADAARVRAWQAL